MSGGAALPLQSIGMQPIGIVRTPFTLVYSFHRIQEPALRVVPFMDTQERGIFATRAPKRPNRIGLSAVRLRSVQGCVLQIEDVDMLDGTPLLDIKPFIPATTTATMCVSAGSSA